MKQIRIIMGMPVVLEIVDISAEQEYFDKVFNYFEYVDKKFSTYKNDSEISMINRGELKSDNYSHEMKMVMTLCEKLKKATAGYFDIKRPDGLYDPSGLVKGWAIQNAAELLDQLGCLNYCLDVGGDIQTRGKNVNNGEWAIGIRNPFNSIEVIKIVYPHGLGVATSGTYIRGLHIYDPHTEKPVESDLVSLTIIGPNIYEADCFATPAFAMGNFGLEFIERLDGFEAYAIDKKGIATMTSGFERFTIKKPRIFRGKTIKV